MRPVFNGALAGRGIDDASEMLLRAGAAGHPPDTVILGIDILDFLIRPSRAEQPLAAVPAPGWPQSWRDPLLATMTIDAAGTVGRRGVRVPEDVQL